MFKDNFSRYEFKYSLSYDDMDRMLDDLSPYVSYDEYANEYGLYTISSIYLENEDLDCYKETMENIRYRQKVRLRVYASNINDLITDDTLSFFEIKCKINGLVKKRRVKMPHGYAMMLLESTTKQIDENTDIQSIFTDENMAWLKTLRSSNPNILRELQYVIISKKLKPKIVVSYERVALFDKSDPSLRITFDMNIRTRDTELDLREGLYGNSTMDKNTAVLEIKTADDIPLWLVKIAAKYGYRNQTFSKYCSHYIHMSPVEGQSLYYRYVISKRENKE